VTITAIGRLGAAITQGQAVVLVLVSAKVPDLPKGLPEPAADTRSTVVVAREQWTRVAEARAAALGAGERPAPATLQLKAAGVCVSVRDCDLRDITQALDALPVQLARLDTRQGERRLVYSEGAWRIDP